MHQIKNQLHSLSTQLFLLIILFKSFLVMFLIALSGIGHSLNLPSTKIRILLSVPWSALNWPLWKVVNTEHAVLLLLVSNKENTYFLTSTSFHWQCFELTLSWITFLHNDLPNTPIDSRCLEWALLICLDNCRLNRT